MSAGHSFKTEVCTEYKSLLHSCQKALEKCRELREQIAELGSARKEEADGLLRLQADYAKAYSRSKRHKDDCALCRYVSEIGTSHAESIFVLH